MSLSSARATNPFAAIFLNKFQNLEFLRKKNQLMLDIFVILKNVKWDFFKAESQLCIFRSNSEYNLKSKNVQKPQKTRLGMPKLVPVTLGKSRGKALTLMGREKLFSPGDEFKF